MATEMPPAPPDATLNAADNLKLACIRATMENEATPGRPPLSGPNGVYCLRVVEDFVWRRCPDSLERDATIIGVIEASLDDRTIGHWSSPDAMLAAMLPDCR